MNGFHPGRSGFTLAEVAIALAVTAFCLVAILGLLPVGMRSNQASVEQTVSNGILSAVITDLRAAPIAGAAAQSGTSQQFQIAIPGNTATNGLASGSLAPPLYFTADGQCSADVNGTIGPGPNGTSYSPPLQTRYLLTITFLPNSGSRSATFVNLRVSWPAAAGVANAVGSVQTLVALDRN